MIPSAAQISRMRTVAEGYLPDSAQVRRKTALVPDGAGGYKPASGDGWTTVETIACRLSASRQTPSEGRIASQVIAPVTYDISVAQDSDVRTEDRLVIAARTFEVQGVAKQESWAILDKLYCVELQK